MRYRLLLLLLLAAVPVAAEPTFNPIQDWIGISGGWPTGSLVKFNGTVFICGTVAPTNCTTAPDTSGEWNSMAGYRAWFTGTTYQPGQMVVRQGSTFMALKQNSGEDPAGGTNPNWASRSITAVPSNLGVANNSATLTNVEIQAAIDSAPAGGIVQLACATYTVNATITITTALTIQGCGPGGMQSEFSSSAVGTQLVGAAAVNIFTVNTVKGVVFRDMVLVPGTGSTSGIVITTPAPATINDRTIIERVWFFGGAIGVSGVAGRVRGTMISHSYFRSQRSAGVSFNGAQTGAGACDSGGYIITDNIFEGPGGVSAPTSSAMLFTNSASVTLVGNQAIAWGQDVVLFTASSCGGPAPSEFQIIGNQFETGVAAPTLGSGRSAIRFDGQFTNIFISSNYLSGTTGSAIDLIATAPNPTFSTTITGNTLRSWGASVVPSTLPALNVANAAGLSITGNNITVGQAGAATNGVLVTGGDVVAITGNNLGLGGAATNGFNLTCASGTTCVCAAGNIFSSGVTNKFSGTASPTGGC